MFSMTAAGAAPLDGTRLFGVGETGQPGISVDADAFKNGAQQFSGAWIFHDASICSHEHFPQVTYAGRADFSLLARE